MTAQIISGTAIATDLLETELQPRVQILNKKNIQPKLVIVLVGDNPASKSYIRQKEKFADKAGILHETLVYSEDITEAELLKVIDDLNADESVHGFMVQAPLPNHIDMSKVVDRINPSKDADGFTPESVGNLFLGEPSLQCCTPKGIIKMIKASGTELSGQHVVVIGRSNIVGKPVAILALNESATVTICHSRTKNLDDHIAQADILIVAVGRAEFVHGDQIKDGTTIIDVGIHRTEEGKLVGDVHFESASKKAKAISPVPGGVGPMTVYCLIENTIEAAEKQVC